MTRAMWCGAATVLTALGLACSSTQPFALTPGMLAGQWTYADQQGDTISVTLTAADTVLSGTGFATDAQLRALSGGTVTDVPMTITGWCSPSRKQIHLEGTSPSVPLFGLVLDATAEDATHILATWTITVNGAPYWTQTTSVVLTKP